eukprot:4162075-Amphidinium_carterae.1
MRNAAGRHFLSGFLQPWEQEDYLLLTGQRPPDNGPSLLGLSEPPRERSPRRVVTTVAPPRARSAMVCSAAVASSSEAVVDEVSLRDAELVFWRRLAERSSSTTLAHQLHHCESESECEHSIAMAFAGKSIATLRKRRSSLEAWAKCSSKELQ